MITSAVITGSVSNPTRVYTSSVDGGEVPASTRQDSAITSIILCNITGATPATVSIYIVKDGDTPDNTNYSNLIVNALVVPAGETVFFSDERIVLDGGDGLYVGATAVSVITATVSSMAI